MSKNSFILHNDSLDVLDELTNEQAGMLLKAMRSYHSGDDLELDSLTKIVFSPFKNQFNRDNLKYQKTCERRAVAGSKGGKQKVANASKPKQKVANLADSDNVSKNDSDNDSDSKLKELSVLKTNESELLNCKFELVWKAYPAKANKKKASMAFQSYIKKNKLNVEIFSNELITDINKRCNLQQFGFDKLHFTTYMNGERWNDAYAENPSNSQCQQVQVSDRKFF